MDLTQEEIDFGIREDDSEDVKERKRQILKYRKEQEEKLKNFSEEEMVQYIVKSIEDASAFAKENNIPTISEDDII